MWLRSETYLRRGRGKGGGGHHHGGVEKGAQMGVEEMDEREGKEEGRAGERGTKYCWLQEGERERERCEMKEGAEIGLH